MPYERRKTHPWGQGGKRNSHTLEPCFRFWGAVEQAEKCFPNYRLADMVTGGTWFSLVMSHKGKRDPTKGSHCHLRAHGVLLPMSVTVRTCPRVRFWLHSPAQNYCVCKTAWLWMLSALLHGTQAVLRLWYPEWKICSKSHKTLRWYWKLPVRGRWKLLGHVSLNINCSISCFVVIKLLCRYDFPLMNRNLNKIRFILSLKEKQKENKIVFTVITD